MSRLLGGTPQPRQLWLCADDYGIAQGVNDAIRDLIMRGRLNATSVMVVARSFNRSEAIALDTLNSRERRVAIGLHVTLTGPFRPLTADYRPLRNGVFLPLEAMLLASFLHRLDRECLAREIAAQIAAFADAFGRTPDFVDGHQHVQLFPKVRDAFLDAVRQAAPNAWVRQCGRWVPLRQRFDRKALLLDVLSQTFRRRARRIGLRTNPGFAGAYDFRKQPDFSKLFPKFLHRLPAGGLVMCHPGLVDDELVAHDPLTSQREQEYAYFASEEFPDVLKAHGFALT